MDAFLDVLIDSLIDTAKILPILLAIYFLIEFLEYKNAFKFEKSKLLTGKWSPVMGSVFGSVPQCGFSVVSTELFTKKKMSVGALIAVYISTSDEAIPIMIANYKSIPALLLLICVKIILGIAIGFLAMWLYQLIFERKKHESAHEATANIDDHNNNSFDEKNNENDNDNNISGCCNHNLKNKKFDWKHPLIHSAKISAFILLANIVLGLIIASIGEEKLISFLSSSNALQPLLAVAIGLIPNCVASVVLTELFLIGGLSFGSIVAGLSVNAGIGLLILLKENKKPKENLFIFLMLIIPSLLIGYALHFIPFPKLILG